MRIISGMKVIAIAAPVAGLILVLGKFALHLPRPLLICSAVLFAASCLLFLLLSKAPGYHTHIQALLLIVAWLISTSSLLALLYRWDRGGWLWYKFTGYDVVIDEQIHPIALASLISRYPGFSIDSEDSTRLLLAPRMHEIHETLVIPPGLRLCIKPGATLCFRPGTSLISYSPVEAVGTASDPIVFRSLDRWRKWGVLGIVSAEQSRFRYAYFIDGRRAHVNGTDFWGALSVHGGAVEIAHCEFRRLTGKDGVNLVDSQVFVHDNVFQDCHKDGLDVDGGSGMIAQNLFIDCMDEGIDLGSNAQLQVHGNIILDSRGGRLSADENEANIRAANRFGRPSELPALMGQTKR